MKDLKVTKEKVLLTVLKCPEAKEALRTMFPEVFEEDKYFDLDKLKIDSTCLFTDESAINAGFENNLFMFVKVCNEYKGKAFTLNTSYNWELTKDSNDSLTLIPTKNLKQLNK